MTANYPALLALGLSLLAGAQAQAAEQHAHHPQPAVAAAELPEPSDNEVPPVAHGPAHQHTGHAASHEHRHGDSAAQQHPPGASAGHAAQRPSDHPLADNARTPGEPPTHRHEAAPHGAHRQHNSAQAPQAGHGDHLATRAHQPEHRHIAAPKDAHRQHSAAHHHQPLSTPTAAERAAAFPDVPTHRHAHRSVPAPSEADRLAAFPRLPPHAMHAGGLNSFLLIDQLEWQDASAGSEQDWDITGWFGGDIDRLQVRTEGARLADQLAEAELQLLWGHAIGPWWETVLGVRQDFKPGPAQTWAAFGFQGTPLYSLETEATAYLGEGGQTALRLQGEYDLRITDRLILQPNAEINLYGRNDPTRGQRSGLSDTRFGLRLRYEIRRNFAPYIGMVWSHAYGDSASEMRSGSESPSESRLVAGLRAWF